jgi:hypothetical protein
MRSRRLLQILACGGKVLSNPFAGLGRLSSFLSWQHLDEGIVLVEKTGAFPESISTASQMKRLVGIVLGKGACA